MPKVVLRQNESQQQLLRRFRKTVSTSGILGAIRNKRWFISKAEQRRIAKKKAIRRIRRNGNKSKHGRSRE